MQCDNICHHRTRSLYSSFMLNRLIVSYPKIIEKLKQTDCTSRADRPFENIKTPSSFHSNWNVFNIVSVLCTCKYSISINVINSCKYWLWIILKNTHIWILSIFFERYSTRVFLTEIFTLQVQTQPISE